MNQHPTDASGIPLRRRGSWLLLSVACLVAAGSALAAAAVATNQLSATSILKDIRNELHDYSKIQSASLLAMVSLEDNRPVYVDHALLVLQLPKGRWKLVNAIRQSKPSPVSPSWNPQWRPHDVRDAPYVAIQTFDHPPTREEMNRFLKVNEFQIESDQFFRVVERLVYDEAWKKVLGYTSGIQPLKRSSAGSPEGRNAGSSEQARGK